MAGNILTVDEREFQEANRLLRNMSKSLDNKFMKSTMAKNSKPIVEQMKAGSHSVRLVKMIGVTRAKRYAGPAGVRVGVVKNNRAMFPKFSAQALGSVIEYGTAERFRKLKLAGIITGRQSTGKMPSKPFLRPAWDLGKNAMINKTVKDIKDKVPK